MGPSSRFLSSGVMAHYGRWPPRLSSRASAGRTGRPYLLALAGVEAFAFRFAPAFASRIRAISSSKPFWTRDLTPRSKRSRMKPLTLASISGSRPSLPLESLNTKTLTTVCADYALGEKHGVDRADDPRELELDIARLFVHLDARGRAVELAGEMADADVEDPPLDLDAVPEEVELAGFPADGAEDTCACRWPDSP